MFGWTRWPGARRALAAVLGLVLLLTFSCGGDTQDLEADAEALFAAGQPEEALTLLRDAARKDTSNGDLQLAIGLALLQLGRPSEAVFPLSKASEFEELRATAGLILAGILLQGENLEEAIVATDRVLEIEPSNVSALVIRCNASLQLHRGETALDSADRLLALDPESLDYQHLRGLALAESDRLDEAEALLLKIVESDAPGASPESLERTCVSLAVALANAKEDERSLDRLEKCEAKFGRRPQVALMLAPAYEKLGLSDEAIELLIRAVAEYPESLELRDKLGTMLIAADRFDEAEQLAMEIVEQNETSQGWGVVASIRSTAGNSKGALEAIERAIELSGTPAQEQLFFRADLLVGLGQLAAAEAQSVDLTEPLFAQIIGARLHYEHGRTQEALDVYEKVIGLWPQNYGVRVFAALAALDLGDRKRARAELLEATRQAPKETDAAIWLARLRFADGEYEGAAYMANRQLGERGPTHPDAYILGARAFARLGETRRAASLLSDMIDARDGLFKAEAVAELGRLLGEKKTVAQYEALVEAHGIDLADPASEAALTQLVQLLHQSGRLDDAKRRLRRLIVTHPERPAPHALMGRVELLLGNTPAATAAVDEALALDPNLASALAAKALILHSQGDLQEAAQAVDAAWVQSPHADYAYMGARLQLDMGNAEEARDRLLELLRDHPDHAAAANDLAWLLANRSERLEQAEQFAHLALRLAPSAPVLDTLGYVQLKRGQAAVAIDSFRKAIDKDPNYATARYHLAMALQESGQIDEARENLEAALETAFPESEEARALLARLPAATTEGSMQ